MFYNLDLPRRWQKPLAGVLLAAAACAMLYWPTWDSIVAIWLRSDTYAHGFLVLPISLWLVWLRRIEYYNLSPKLSVIGLVFMALCGFLWLTANLVHVLVVQQFAVVGLLLSAIWAILGNQVSLKLAFPLVFLFLMVPFGEDFVPFLMEYTATFVVAMLKLSGITVYRQGLHFTLTSGNWSVVDACSGIRYLIASFTLGCIYAYVNYTSYKKRAVFILISVIVPILANGIRAYLIVLLGHLSGMKLATGVDHIIYGWFFFGLVMLLLFYLGSFWREPPKMPVAYRQQALTFKSYAHYQPLLFAIMLISGVWPLLSEAIISQQGAHVEIPQDLISADSSEWRETGQPNWGWQPQFQGVVAGKNYFLTDGVSVVGVYVANFGDESKGELINSQNVLVSQKDRTWQIVKTNTMHLDLTGKPAIEIEETVLQSAYQALLVSRWYRLGSENTANSYQAKYLQLLKRLSGNFAPELLIVIYTEIPNGDYQLARVKLKAIAAACCGKLSG